MARPELVKSDFVRSDLVKSDSAKSDSAKSDSGKSNSGFDYDRYRKLLAEATDEQKRLAFINILIAEKAKDSLALQSLRATLADMGLTKPRES
jgi:hypothetical protein